MLSDNAREFVSTRIQVAIQRYWMMLLQCDISDINLQNLSKFVIINFQIDNAAESIHWSHCTDLNLAGQYNL